MPSSYVLSCNVFAVATRVAVNDVPVLVRDEVTSLQTTIPINPWLGEEDTELRIEAGGVLDGEDPAGKLEVTLLRQTSDDAVTTLLSVVCPKDLTASEIVVRGGTWICRKVIRLPGLDRPPSELWPTAQTIALTDDDRAAIHEHVKSLQRAYDEGDMALLDRELAFQRADLARALHTTTDEVRDFVAMAIQGALRDEEDVGIDPQSEQGLAHLDQSMEIHLVARDRLVWVTRDDFSHPLRVPATGAGFHMPLYLAKRSGRWTAVR